MIHLYEARDGVSRGCLRPEPPSRRPGPPPLTLSTSKSTHADSILPYETSRSSTQAPLDGVDSRLRGNDLQKGLTTFQENSSRLKPLHEAWRFGPRAVSRLSD